MQATHAAFYHTHPENICKMCRTSRFVAGKFLTKNKTMQDSIHIARRPDCHVFRCPDPIRGTSASPIHARGLWLVALSRPIQRISHVLLEIACHKIRDNHGGCLKFASAFSEQNLKGSCPSECLDTPTGNTRKALCFLPWGARNLSGKNPHPSSQRRAW